MNKTSIEWVKNPDGSQGYTWNPITGCLFNDNGLCKGGGFPCYACKLAHGRVKRAYIEGRNEIIPKVRANEGQMADPFRPRFWEERLNFDGVKRPHSYTYIGSIKGHKPFGCFVCDMGDLFGIGVPEEWTRRVLNKIGQERYDECRFYLLTKQPQNLIKLSPFPDNAWVGVTATNDSNYVKAFALLSNIEASVKYISFEPLLGRISDTGAFMKSAGINWLIIGACTGTVKNMSHLFDKYPQLTIVQDGKRWTAQPRIEWLQEIVEAADKAGIKVFLKDNLKPLFQNAILEDTNCLTYPHGELRQELPNA